MSLLIAFRVSGELEQELVARAAGRATGGPSGVVRAEWLAWRELFRHATPTFGQEEATLLLDVLNGTWLGPEQAHLLWASVEDARVPRALAARYPGIDLDALVARLRALDRLQAIATVWAVERAWDLLGGPEALTVSDALRHVGLVREGASDR